MKEGNQQIITVGDKVQRNQDVTPIGDMAPTNNLVAPTPRIPQPKIDATDRKQIEAQNEDKSHTTKEALDDIKHIYYKEKKKKEQDNMEPGQSGIESYYIKVSIRLILVFPFLHCSIKSGNRLK